MIILLVYLQIRDDWEDILNAEGGSVKIPGAGSVRDEISDISVRRAQSSTEIRCRGKSSGQFRGAGCRPIILDCFALLVRRFRCAARGRPFD